MACTTVLGSSHVMRWLAPPSSTADFPVLQGLIAILWQTGLWSILLQQTVAGATDPIEQGCLLCAILPGGASCRRSCARPLSSLCCLLL